MTGSDAVGLAMGYFDTRQLPIYQYLHDHGHPRYAIADNGVFELCNEVCGGLRQQISELDQILTAGAA